MDVRATPGTSTLAGWRNCTDAGCGKNLLSAYSTFVFLRVDAERQPARPVVVVPAGRHWIEAHYAWGAGLITGIGNWRNYAFEFDFQAGHQYAIEQVPAGCVVPATRRWVSARTLRIVDTAPSGQKVVHETKAMEFCSPSSEEAGSCTRDADCRFGPCTPFGGSTGFGLCGALRD